MSKIKLGIVGGGQLGRMSAQAAEKLGVHVVIFTPESDSPASHVAPETIVAAYDDEKALQAFAAKVDYITYEFENIPVETVSTLKHFKPVFPDERLLEIAQDRVREKTFLNDIEIQTARWASVSGPRDVQKFMENSGIDACIVKTTRFGYDGKGQIRINPGDDIPTAVAQLNAQAMIAEEIVGFICEISVIVARDKDGAMEVYGPMENNHKNHILQKTVIPATIDADLSRRAVDYAHKLAEAVNLRGVLGLEMFVTRDNRLLANEIAPRTHNSGHWSIDACAVSQFENHVRAVCGLPVMPQQRHADAVMINLIGDDIKQAERYAAQENARVHTYGKQDVKQGRKMGHVTILETKK